MAYRRAQVERVMRLVAMQVNRHAGDGDVRQPQRDDDVTPGRQTQQAIKRHHRPRMSGP